MFWVGLATAIMLMTGDGDDSASFARFDALMRDAVTASVADPIRQRRALEAVDATLALFIHSREQLSTYDACMEAADRKYAVTAQDYAKCQEQGLAVVRARGEGLARARQLLLDNVRPEELEKMGAFMLTGNQ